MSDGLDRPVPGVAIAQPSRGFRYGSEPFWVVGFALDGGRPRTAVDLGTGSGVAAALLAAVGVDALGVDLRDEWAPYWARTLAATRTPGALALRVEDVRDLCGRFDLAVSNPPYFPLGAGPASPDPLKSAARTESTATLTDFLRVGQRVAERLCVVIPRDREEEAVAFASPRRITRVGKVRSLVAWEPGPGGPASIEQISEADAIRWYPAR